MMQVAAADGKQWYISKSEKIEVVDSFIHTVLKKKEKKNNQVYIYKIVTYN